MDRLLTRLLAAIAALTLLAAPAGAQRVGVSVGIGVGGSGGGSGGGTPVMTGLTGTAVSDAAIGTVLATPSTTLPSCSWSLAAQANFAQASSTGIVTKAATIVSQGSYSPVTSCAVTANSQTVTLTAPLLLTITPGSGPTAVPLAPSVVPTGGNAQAQLAITDDPASQQVKKWGIYEATTSGGTQTFSGWAYTKDQLYRRYLANGASAFYRVTAWNVLGEGPKSSEVSATAASTAFNPLRLAGTLFFHNTLFYEPLVADFRSGSTVTVSASDGTALSVKTQNGAIIVYGTFAATGGDRDVTLTYVETPSGGGASNTSTQVVRVVARPTPASYAAVKPTAQAIKARMTAPPSYAGTGTITITDTGSTIPTGYVATKVVYPGKSIYPPGAYTAIGGFMPPQYSSPGYDPVEAIPLSQVYMGQSNAANNAVLRLRLTRQTWILGMNADGGSAVGHFVARFSDDNMATWTEVADPTFVRFQAGTRYMKLDGGTVPPSGGRVWEVEFSSFSYLANSQYVNGFAFESGETVSALTDTSPIAAIHADSYANGVGAIVQTRNMLRTAARDLGLLNAWNLAIPAHRWTYPATASFPLALDRIGANVLGVGDLDMPPKVDLWLPNATINDHAQTDATQAQAMWTNAWLRARYKKPLMLIVPSIGFWNPQDRITTPLYNAFVAAYTDASGNGADKGMRLNDGVAAGWAVASGATGSSPYFFANNSVTITAGTSASTLTVSTGSGIEAGMYLYNAGGTDLKVRVYKQLSGATGGAGTYQLEAQPNGGDIAAGTSLSLRSENYTASYPVHPNPAGQVWAGHRLSDAAAALVNDVVANAP